MVGSEPAGTSGLTTRPPSSSVRCTWFSILVTWPSSVCRAVTCSPFSTSGTMCQYSKARPPDVTRIHSRERNVTVPSSDGVDGGAAGGGDVDALVEREAAVRVHEGVHGRRPVKLHARVAEVRANQMLAVERLDGVAVGLSGDGLGGQRAGRLGDAGAGGERTRECERDGGCDRDGGGEAELRDGRAKDAAPCAANWDVEVGSHAATVRRVPNRPVTGRQRFANGDGLRVVDTGARGRDPPCKSRGDPCS